MVRFSFDKTILFSDGNRQCVGNLSGTRLILYGES